MENIDGFLELIQEVSPEIWRVLVERARNDAMMGLAMSLCALASLAFAWNRVKKGGKVTIDADLAVKAVIEVSAIAAIVAIAMSARALADPEYHALMEIIRRAR